MSKYSEVLAGMVEAHVEFELALCASFYAELQLLVGGAK